jgi:hypothetical protein
LRYRALTKRKYRRLFSSNVPKKPGPKGPTQDVIVAVIDMRRRNPTCGCPRIAQQIALAFGIPIKDVAAHSCRPVPAGPRLGGLNGHHTHAGLTGRTPDPSVIDGCARASVSSYRWQPHCRGLYRTPMAA